MVIQESGSKDVNFAILPASFNTMTFSDMLPSFLLLWGVQEPFDNLGMQAIKIATVLGPLYASFMKSET